MNNINWKSDVLPHALIILGFLALTFLFLNPLLEGKVLYQSDIVQWKGMAQEILEHTEETGEQALWTNRPFAGMPSFLIHTNHKTNILRYVDQVISFGLNGKYRPAKILLLLFIGFYLGCLIFGINKWLSAIGAIAFALSTYFIVSLEAGHNTKIIATAYMLPVVASLFFAYRKNVIWGALLLAIFLGLNINGNHVQITYYTLLIGLVVFIVELVNAIRAGKIQRFAKTTGLLAAAAILALGLNSGRLMTTYFHSQETTRGGGSELQQFKQDNDSGLGYDYAMAWSYGIKESLTLLVPNFAGGASAGPLSESSNVYNELLDARVPKQQAKELIKQLPLYYGDLSMTGGPIYFGAIICFLFLLAMIILPWKNKTWALATVLLSLFLAWGSNFFLADLFYNIFPLYNKFRTPMMILTMAGVVFPLISMVGLQYLFSADFNKKNIQKYLFIAAGITAGLCLFIAFMGSAFWNFSSPRDMQLLQGYNQAAPGLGTAIVDALKSDRQSLMRMDALRSFVLIALAAGALWLFINDKIKKGYVIAILGLLIVGDLWFVGKRYVTNEDFTKERDLERAFKLGGAEQDLKKEKGNFRVLNLTRSLDGDGITAYSFNNIGGYSAAKLRRFQDVLDGYLKRGNQPVLNMLNTKFVIGQDGKLQNNPAACGNAWLAKKISWVNTADEEFAKLDLIDACSEAVFNNDLKSSIKTKNVTGNGSIRLVNNDMDVLEYDVDAKGNQIAIFSEIFYNAGGGWQATIDGKATEVLRANYLLRAIEVPSGKHKVVFTFAPSFYRNGEILSGVSSLILLTLAGFLIFKSLGNMPKGTELEAA